MRSAMPSSVFAEAYGALDPGRPPRDLGTRVAAGIGAASVGALDRRRARAREQTSVEVLTPAEYHATALARTGAPPERTSSITRRAEACLAHVIERDPDDARALALQATVHAPHYRWGDILRTRPNAAANGCREDLSAPPEARNVALCEQVGSARLQGCRSPA